MANIPGATNVLPGVFTDIITQTRGVSIPGGTRVAAVIGEGITNETVVVQANGGGDDGLDPTYTSDSGSDGRHFQLSAFPLISARTKLYKNGVILNGLESVIDGSVFNSKYDYRVDVSTGQVELQRSHLRDQGGAFYTALTTNTGDGYVANLTLVDTDSPSETWTFRCVGVQRDNSNNPVDDTAKFIAFGSVSGAKVDANGNPIVWVADGAIVSNGVVSLAIWETKSTGSSVAPFVEGDAFVVIVDSGVLTLNDSLTANYIPTAVLNDPLVLGGLDDVVTRHGSPTAENALSLGSQLAFANSSPVVMTVQAAPSMPRRTSYGLADTVDRFSTNDDDFIFPLPDGVVPDADSAIHFFVTDPVTKVETQILPNKLAYYLLDESGEPTTAEFIATGPTAGTYDFSYTVDAGEQSLHSNDDGYVGRIQSGYDVGVFSTPSVVFNSEHVGKKLYLQDAANTANVGEYLVTSVSNGALNVQRATSGNVSATFRFPDFTAETSVTFVLIDPLTGAQLPVITEPTAATDGVLAVVGAGTDPAEGTVDSAAIDFDALEAEYGGDLSIYKLQINGSATNNGLYDITGNSSDLLTIRKTVVTESAMRYNLVDPAEESNYVVLNSFIVPDGNSLRVTLITDADSDFFDSGWITALDSLESVECDIVVPLPRQTVSAIVQNTLNHCLSMSNIVNRRERVMFTGGLPGLTPNNVLGLTPAAVADIGVLEGIQGDSVTEVLAGNVEDLANYSVPDAFGHTYRSTYFYPDEIVVNANGTNIAAPGMYLAAAAAGYLSADPKLENPLTNKVLSGFTLLRTKRYPRRVLRDLAQAGITVLQPVTGGGRVIWGRTTSQSGFVEEQEQSIVFIRDRIAKTLRASFAGFIGKPETDVTKADISSRAILTLNSLKNQNLITQYVDLSVKRDETDPTQWNIGVRVQPTYPINFIYIKVNVGKL